MTKSFLPFTACCAVLLTGSVGAQFPSLTVKVIGVAAPTGSLEVSLFNSPEDFMKEPFRQQSGTLDESSEFVAVFDDLPAGEYAAVVVHDANDNGRLDTGFLGIGSEQYGFSNDVAPWFGWPDFEDAKFSVEDAAEIVIDLD